MESITKKETIIEMERENSIKDIKRKERNSSMNWIWTSLQNPVAWENTQSFDSDFNGGDLKKEIWKLSLVLNSKKKKLKSKLIN